MVYGLWLLKDISRTIGGSQGSKQASPMISTLKESPTYLTT